MRHESLIMACSSDMAGQVRGKAFRARDFDKRCAQGVGWCPAQAAMTAFDTIVANPFGSVGDVLLMPDPATRVAVDFGTDDPGEHFVLVRSHLHRRPSLGMLPARLSEERARGARARGRALGQGRLRARVPPHHARRAAAAGLPPARVSRRRALCRGAGGGARSRRHPDRPDPSRVRRQPVRDQHGADRRPRGGRSRRGAARADLCGRGAPWRAGHLRAGRAGDGGRQRRACAYQPAGRRRPAGDARPAGAGVLERDRRPVRRRHPSPHAGPGGVHRAECGVLSPSRAASLERVLQQPGAARPRGRHAHRRDPRGRRRRRPAQRRVPAGRCDGQPVSAARRGDHGGPAGYPRPAAARRSRPRAISPR